MLQGRRGAVLVGLLGGAIIYMIGSITIGTQTLAMRAFNYFWQ
jgi:hypothetical protein